MRDADSLLLLKSSAFLHRWNERQVKANGNRQLRSLLPSRRQRLTRSPKVVACHLSLPTAKRGARSVSMAIAPWGTGDADESCNIPAKLFLLTFRMRCHLQNRGFGGMEMSIGALAEKGGERNPSRGQGRCDNVRAEVRTRA